MDKELLKIVDDSNVVKLILEIKKDIEDNEQQIYSVLRIKETSMWHDCYHIEMRNRLLTKTELENVINIFENYGDYIKILDINGKIIFEQNDLPPSGENDGYLRVNDGNEPLEYMDS